MSIHFFWATPQTDTTLEHRYSGGLGTCHHDWFLLDSDQEIPWQDQPLIYYKKFRIYYQAYNESYHKQIVRQDWGIGADGDNAEYDVVQCDSGTPVSECVRGVRACGVREYYPLNVVFQSFHVFMFQLRHLKS